VGHILPRASAAYRDATAARGLIDRRHYRSLIGNGRFPPFITGARDLIDCLRRIAAARNV